MTTAEFDYQWANLPSANTTYTPERVPEFLKLVKLPLDYFWEKKCLDAGCGNGRWTYVMQYLGADVDSFDISPEAVAQCRKVNPRAEVKSILNLTPENRVYDFVLCWGVLHHMEHPRTGFRNVSWQVKPGGTLHVMLYHKHTQTQYTEGRWKWSGWTKEQRLAYCEQMVAKHGGDLHGWWDAFNPTYNWGFTPGEVKTLFESYGFGKMKMTQRYNINMRGIYRG